MEIKISKDIRGLLFAHAKKDAPVEACGYLAGKKTDKAIDIVECYPLTNMDKSEEHFSFDPKEQFEVVRDARKKGLDLVAVYHSHPHSPARPSGEDLKLAYDPNIVHLIVSLLEGKEEIKAFDINNGKAKEIPLHAEGAGETDVTEMKKVGMIQQKQKELFAMRLRAVGGDLKTEQLKRIAEVADKYADGEVHLSVRQGVEIHNIKQNDLGKAREELEKVGVRMGACGPRIRVIVACPGSATCRWGIVETKELARELDAKYFRKDMPHKFKISVTGCPNNCAKATENDIGIMGGILPKWEKEECIYCDLCVNVCPTKAIYKEGEEYKLDRKKCILCSICTTVCPTNSWVPAKKGFTVFIGGTMGKKPRLGTRLIDLVEDKKVLMRLIERTVRYYQENGRKKERFGHSIDRIGEKKVIKELLGGL
jgi:dissimilatory sulfite reductase (desulfoviridin) alpha/beta subunit